MSEGFFKFLAGYLIGLVVGGVLGWFVTYLVLLD